MKRPTAYTVTNGIIISYLYNYSNITQPHRLRYDRGMKLLARLAERHAKLVLIVSSILVLAGVWYGAGVFSSLTSSDDTFVEGSQSHEVAKFIQAQDGSKTDAVILFGSKQGSDITTDTYRNEIGAILKTLDVDASMTTYYDTGAPAFVSRDKTQTFVAIEFKDKDSEANFQALKALEESAAGNKIVTTHIGGSLVASKQITHQIEADLVTAELISLPILALLLLLFFRSVVAASLPLVIGMIAIAGGLAVTRLLTNVMDIDQYAINVITVLGLGLSVDYSLLMVNRYREELESHPPGLALKRTVMTSGRTILFSGLTVMVSLLVLTLFPISFLRSVGIGGASALLVAMIAALTIMPALLSLLGEKINRFKIGKGSFRSSGALWRSIGERVMRFPLLVTSVMILTIIAVSYPILSTNFKANDYTVLPENSSARVVGDVLANNFDDQKAPIVVLYENQNIASPGGQLALVSFIDTLMAQDGAKAIVGVTTHGNVTVIKLLYDGEVTGTTAQKLVADIRALQPDGGTVRVGGTPAIHVDVTDTVIDRMPLAAGIIAISMFILLALLLRSILIPIAAIVINTFALLAAFGIIIIIFQFGFLTDISWLHRTDGLDITTPLLIFAIAFGLSMDYAVFLYSRIREEYDRTHDTTEAILSGLQLTGPLITQAALLLFVVVAAFASSQIAILQQIGVGLALAVLLDAFIVRVIFVPAIMKLFGDANWWAPKWLDRFSIKHE